MVRELFVRECEGVPLYEVDLRAGPHVYDAKYPHRMVLRPDIRQWLQEHVGAESYDYNHMFMGDWRAQWCCNLGTQLAFFQFRSKERAMLFKLTWA